MLRNKNGPQIVKLAENKKFIFWLTRLLFDVKKRREKSGKWMEDRGILFIRIYKYFHIEIY